MTSLSLWSKRSFAGTARCVEVFGPWRLAVVAALALLAALSPDASGIIVQTISDAFLQVTVFVAATLSIFYCLETFFRIDAGALLARNRGWHVPIAAVLGALPGCGGAIMVITQYIRGSIGFGSVVAVLTSTMGDAAFLLLAREPLAGLGVMAVGFSIGIASGYAVDFLHGPDFMRYAGNSRDAHGRTLVRRVDSRFWRRLWYTFVVPGLGFGVLIAFQGNTAVFGSVAGIETVTWVGAGGAVVSILLWGSVTPQYLKGKCGGESLGWASASEGRLGDASARAAGDTCFVTVWVVFALLFYELGSHFGGIDLQALFRVGAPLVQLIAILVGFIPGCGPQVVVATLYLGGVIPFSAELGNAISNDGDALFPAIAMAPRAAVVATAYSAIPALIVAYGWFWLFE